MYRQQLLARRDGKDIPEIPPFIPKQNITQKTGKQLEAESRARMAAKFGKTGVGKGFGTNSGQGSTDSGSSAVSFLFSPLAIVTVIVVAAMCVYLSNIQ